MEEQEPETRFLPGYASFYVLTITAVLYLGTWFVFGNPYEIKQTKIEPKIVKISNHTCLSDPVFYETYTLVPYVVHALYLIKSIVGALLLQFIAVSHIVRLLDK